jgi:hypothetical protein
MRTALVLGVLRERLSIPSNDLTRFHRLVVSGAPCSGSLAFLGTVIENIRGLLCAAAKTPQWAQQTAGRVRDCQSFLQSRRVRPLVRSADFSAKKRSTESLSPE